MKDLRINHMFMLQIAEIFASKREKPKILDFGCGDGIIVKEGKKRGYDIYGTDLFYGNQNEIKDEIHQLGYSRDIISEIKDGKIAFKDNNFDLVICNQVFEHIENFNTTLLEINRVLKPNGYLFCIFPPKDSFIEWHVGIPFIHWLPKKSVSRFLFLLFFRALGFGFNKENSSIYQWTLDKLWYLEEFTFYRSVKNIIRIFSLLYNVEIVKFDSFNPEIELHGKLRKMGKILLNPLFLRILGRFQNHWNLILIASKKLRKKGHLK